MKRALLPLLLFLCYYVPLRAGTPAGTYPDSLNNGRAWLVSGTGIAVYTGGLYFLGQVWYKGEERVPFHTYDDWRGYLQMDKCGHAYAAYWESYAAYEALRWAGVKRSTALIVGGATGFLFQAPIEVFDGLYEGWGFSWPDVAANALGSVLFATQQGLWDEQIIHMKFSYAPSPYRDVLPSSLGETHLESFFLDYNGHTYWLSVNLQRITGANGIPKWLNLALGYSGNGMFGEFDNPARRNAGVKVKPPRRRHERGVGTAVAIPLRSYAVGHEVRRHP